VARLDVLERPAVRVPGSVRKGCPMSDKIPTELPGVLDRAIELCSKFTPVEHRVPTPGGGNVLTTATGLLVAVRAVVEAFIEHDKATKAKGASGGET
jgi:hypothetical protein